MTHSSTAGAREAGFTLVELMVVVAIIAALVAVAVVSYTRHIKSTRILDAKVFISTIQARQETYFQQYGVYLDVSGTDYYPAFVPGQEPVAKPWSPAGAWLTLGARPESGVSYFQYRVTASSGPAHTVAASSLEQATGIPPQPTGGVPHPWYYIVARANLDGKGSCGDPPPLDTGACTMLYASSARSEIVVLNEGQ